MPLPVVTVAYDGSAGAASAVRVCARIFPGARVAALDGPALLAYDGSDAAAQAVSVAVRVLADRPAVIVHDWESPYRHTLTGRLLADVHQPDLQDIVDGLDELHATAATHVTDAGVALARGAGLDARGETLDSGAGPWRALAAAARTLEAAVIVAGARGLAGAASVLLGSVSSGLVHSAEQRTRSRSPSCSGVGGCTNFSAPERCKTSSRLASRRSVFTRAPGATGVKAGATMSHATPIADNNR
jgi:nucleotide-binding universal stress UspA family protein